MRSRFPLLLKKRGRRRTGSQRWAQAGELLYQMMFVLAGAVGCWWLFQDVLLPEARLAREAASFETATCEVVDARVATRPGLAEPEYCGELLVRFDTNGGEPIEVWTRHGVGRDMPSREEARAALGRFEIGAEQRCWYDPADPGRVLLSVRRRWWPWLILSVPLSLVAAGSFGVGLTLLSTRSSPERRSALQKRVTRAAGGETKALPVEYALPPAEGINDSPGVRLAYRLPMDGAEGWRVLGMAVACVLWNALAAVFVFQLTAGTFSVGGRIGLSVLAIAPLAATGAWLTYSLLRDARTAGGAGVTRVEVSKHPLRPGESCEALLLHTGAQRVRAITVSLVCTEEATYHQGTDTRTTTAEVYREIALRERPGEGQALPDLGYSFPIHAPAEGPPSFVAPNNRIVWSLEVVTGSPRRPDAVSRYRLCVYPASIEEPTAAPSLSA